jgi:hypothetical protein
VLDRVIGAHLVADSNTGSTTRDGAHSFFSTLHQSMQSISSQRIT